MSLGIIGTLAALGLQRVSGFWRNVFDGLIYIAIMVPSVVIGIATLVAFVTLFNIDQSLRRGAARLSIPDEHAGR